MSARFGFGLLASGFGKVVGFFDGGVKKVAEKGASGASSAVDEAQARIQDFTRNPNFDPSNQSHLDHIDAILDRAKSSAQSSVTSAAADASPVKRFLPLGVVAAAGIAGAQPAISGAAKAWETGTREAGNTNFFHGIFDWIAKFMENFGLDDKFPDAKAWLDERTNKNQGIVGKMQNNVAKISEHLQEHSLAYAGGVAGVTALGVAAAVKSKKPEIFNKFSRNVGSDTPSVSNTTPSAANTATTGVLTESPSAVTAAKSPGMFSKMSSGLSNIGGKLLRRLPVIGAVATTVGVATMTADTATAAEAVDASTSFESATEVSSVEQTALSDTLDAKETALGGLAVSGAVGSAAGLAATFALASNPVGWTVAASIGIGIGASFASEYVANRLTVDGEGTSLSEWAGNKLSSSWRAASDWIKGEPAATVQAVAPDVTQNYVPS